MPKFANPETLSENSEISEPPFHQRLREIAKRSGLKLNAVADATRVNVRTIFNKDKEAEESWVEFVIECLGKAPRWKDSYAEDLRAAAIRWRESGRKAAKRRPRAAPNAPAQTWFGIDHSQAAACVGDSSAQTADSEPATAHSSAGKLRIDVVRVDGFAPPRLIGRDKQLKILSKAWQDAVDGVPDRPSIVTLFALGGEGKSSIVGAWVDDLRRRGWPGCESVFAWSFYAQGTSSSNASSSTFLTEAIAHFEGGSPQAEPDNEDAKARHLAELLDRAGRLLVLDGIEPLQTAATPASSGQITNVPLATLLTRLASGRHRGLCIVTTRYAIANLATYGTLAPQIRVTRLSKASSVALLKSLRTENGTRIHGLAEEFKQLAHDLQGHALTLSLMGSYLLRAHEGAIQMRDQVRFGDADEQVVTGASFRIGHAFRVMDAYVDWFERSGKRGRRALVLMRLVGLFDRPATLMCLDELLAGERIAGLTDDLVAPRLAELNLICHELEAAGLVTTQRDDTARRQLLAVDAHPLVREYFADRLRRRQECAWRKANARLYELLAATALADEPQSQAEFEPFYQAILHGCRAGKQQSAFDNVFLAKICGGKRQLSTSRFGAVDLDLAALAHFFEPPWELISRNLSDTAAAEINSLAGFRLRSAGRFAEAAPLIKRSLEFYESVANWSKAADGAGNLSVLFLNAGDLRCSLRYAEQSIAHAERNLGGMSATGRARRAARHLLSGRLATLGDALIQYGPGKWAEAHAIFERAEVLQRENDRHRPQLFSTRGYRLHELLLDEGDFEEVIRRTRETATWVSEQNELLDPGLNKLMAGRAHLARWRHRQTGADRPIAEALLKEALAELRFAGFQDAIVRALLAQADFLSVDMAANFKLVEQNLVEARTIALRGPMPLLQADVHLLRARCFRPAKGRRPTPWQKSSARQDLAEARKLIASHGYGRRQHELEELDAIF